MSKHPSHLNQIIQAASYYKGENLEKRVKEVLNDVACVARNEENHRLKGKIQRRSEAVLRKERYSRSDNGEDLDIPWPEYGELIVTVYSSEGGSRGKSTIRVLPTHYGVMISGDAPVFVDKEASNNVKVIATGRSEYHEIWGEVLKDE